MCYTGAIMTTCLLWHLWREIHVCRNIHVLPDCSRCALRLIFKLFPKRYKCSTRKRELFIMQLYNQHGEPRAGETWYFIRNLYKFQVYGISEGRVCKWLRMSSCKLHTVYIYIYLSNRKKSQHWIQLHISLIYMCVCLFYPFHFILYQI